MTQDITSKNIDGITDLVVIAPIREGFIEAYENVTYATRLKLVAEALNRVRVAAREHERITPFSDVTERILTLLDFRVGIIDKDLLALRTGRGDGKGEGKAEGDGEGAETTSEPSGIHLESRRYLYLTATFDGAWEPYMRLIWDPLGPFLDLLFCNCDGYVTATEHSFEEYAQWVRDNQMDSSIFYATTGMTIRDSLYLSKLERVQRAGGDALALAELTMPFPEKLAADTRGNPIYQRKAVELGLEALTVLYKLADYYPPQWLTGNAGKLAGLNEGHRLAQVARDLLLGWDGLAKNLDALLAMDPVPPALEDTKARWKQAREVYAEPLLWYETGRDELASRTRERDAAREPDPEFIRSEVQGGILKPQGSAQAPVQHGALMLFTVHEAGPSRGFLKSLDVHYAQGAGSESADGLYRTVGLTPDGLLRIGVDREVVRRFPKEFQEGMAARSGLLGDMRENHPRNWILPERNGPALMGIVPADMRLPPVELSEVDFVVQLRSTDPDRAVVEAEVKRLACAASAGATLQAVEWLEGSYDPVTGRFVDHFGFTDGISQPKLRLADETDPAPAAGRDSVAAGEVLLGYGNDRSDAAPGKFATLDDWRRKPRQEARALQKNGTFLVLRKIGEEVDAFEQWLDDSVLKINGDHALAIPMTKARLKALVLGREADGKPLLPSGAGGENDFDYGADEKGQLCPFASHVRRANPRRTETGPGALPLNKVEFGRPTPRLLRRGMRYSKTDAGGATSRGLMFMGYNASIAEQYETIQRWLNGGNSTNVSSAQNDPLTGVLAKSEPGVFRFVEKGVSGDVVGSIVLRAVTPGPSPTGASEPGRHPFTPLHWGLYLFVPSRKALALLAAQTGEWSILAKPLENAVGQVILDRLSALAESSPELAGAEWKQLLEDFDTKDPSQRDLTPSVWATIRWRYGGAYRLNLGIPPSGYDWQNGPNPKQQNIVLCAGADQVRQVLADWRTFTTEEQLRRIAPNSGPIFVTQQPDDRYNKTELQEADLHYPAESTATNAILLEYGEEAGFADGYAAGAEILRKAKDDARALKRDAFKLELRRQFLLPALARLCHAWYGLPDGTHMKEQGWTWQRFAKPGEAASALTRTHAHCPGDFLSPSRNAFYPRPSDAVGAFAADHGSAILEAANGFVSENRATGGPPVGYIAQKMFAAIADDKVLARNLIGTMVGAIPPMDGNLRGILLEWLGEKSLWRHQAAMRTALVGQPASSDFAKARAVLYRPVVQAMCKRPAPDLLYRTATGQTTIPREPPKHGKPPRPPIAIEEGDLVVVSQVAASQRSLLKLFEHDNGLGDVSIVFGGRRREDTDDTGACHHAAAQGYKLEGGQAVPDPEADPQYPVHACPAQDMAMGAIMGIMAALLDAGTIQALPASLIVKIGDWD